MPFEDRCKVKGCTSPSGEVNWMRFCKECALQFHLGIMEDDYMPVTPAAHCRICYRLSDTRVCGHCLLLARAEIALGLSPLSTHLDDIPVVPKKWADPLSWKRVDGEAWAPSSYLNFYMKDGAIPAIFLEGWGSQVRWTIWTGEWDCEDPEPVMPVAEVTGYEVAEILSIPIWVLEKYILPDRSHMDDETPFTTWDGETHSFEANPIALASVDENSNLEWDLVCGHANVFIHRYEAWLEEKLGVWASDLRRWRLVKGAARVNFQYCTWQWLVRNLTPEMVLSTLSFSFATSRHCCKHPTLPSVMRSAPLCESCAHEIWSDAVGC